MRTKFGKTMAAVCVMAAVGAYAADKETGLTGNWATDAALTAVAAQTSGGLSSSILQNAIKQGTSAVPTGGNNGFGGGGGGFGGGGRRFAQFGGGGGGGQFGGGQVGGGGGQFGGGGGGGQFGGGGGGFGGGGGQFGGGRNINLDTGPAKVVKEGQSVDGVALTMTIIADKKKIKSGSEVYDVVKKQKDKIEEGVVDGNKFEFKVYKKVGDIRIATIYKGELMGPEKITLQRLKPGGDPFDKKEDGTADILEFNRAAKK